MYSQLLNIYSNADSSQLYMFNLCAIITAEPPSSNLFLITKKTSGFVSRVFLHRVLIKASYCYLS